jgi:hypothetical protein
MWRLLLLNVPRRYNDCEAVIEGTLSREEARARSLARALAAD